VWLPANYDKQKKYAVLYMHDGQGLFDASITWNHQSWDIDDAITSLVAAHKIKDVIVVGIWNGQTTRHAEYFPQKAFEQLSISEMDTVTAQLQRASRTKESFKPISDNYLKFLVTELKPFIDKNYSTQVNKENTFIAGSSMGGLISMYAICEYPTIFGGAACMSTHWPGSFEMQNNPIPDAFVNYMRKNLPNPKQHKIYFDYGDQTLDALYPPLQQKVDVVMKAKGYSEKNWMTKFFPGDNHSELSWSKRVPIPLEFLLGNQ
jgi:predicted alpha/beta superfamily hydrolase